MGGSHPMRAEALEEREGKDTFPSLPMNAQQGQDTVKRGHLGAKKEWLPELNRASTLVPDVQCLPLWEAKGIVVNKSSEKAEGGGWESTKQQQQRSVQTASWSVTGLKGKRFVMVLQGDPDSPQNLDKGSHTPRFRPGRGGQNKTVQEKQRVRKLLVSMHRDKDFFL